MNKIPTLFVRNTEDRRYVTREVTPGCEWVIEGVGRPTRKFDGTCVLLTEDGDWWARREVKPDKWSPPDFMQENYDPVTGKRVGWEPAEQSSFWRYLQEAIHNPNSYIPRPGTYELCGPKINGNPEELPNHTVVPHGYITIADNPRTFESLASYMAQTTYEGIVWHHPDGRMCKLKKRDFPA